MVVGEIVQLGTLEIEHTDHPAFVNHGDSQLGARLGVHRQIARIAGHVGNQYWLFESCRRANDAFAGRCTQFSLHTMPVLHVDAVPKNLQFFVVEHDAQNLVVDHPLGLLGGTAQQLLNVQDRTSFPADFIQEQQSVGLRTHLLK